MPHILKLGWHKTFYNDFKKKTNQNIPIAGMYILKKQAKKGDFKYSKTKSFEF